MRFAAAVVVAQVVDIGATDQVYCFGAEASCDRCELAVTYTGIQENDEFFDGAQHQQRITKGMHPSLNVFSWEVNFSLELTSMSQC